MRSAAALALALFAAAAAASQAKLPEPLGAFAARYEVGNGSIKVGTATFTLARDSGLWRYRTDLEARGLFAMFVEEPMRETTWLEARDEGLRPVIYRRQEGDAGVRVVFDWSAGRARVNEDGDRREVELEPGTLDQLSAILSVMVALAAGERSIAFPGLDEEGDRKELRFEATGEETVEVPSGRYDAIRVERRHDDERTTTTWLAPALDWLPVRVEQREDGDLVARLELIAGETASAE